MKEQALLTLNVPTCIRVINELNRGKAPLKLCKNTFIFHLYLFCTSHFIYIKKIKCEFSKRLSCYQCGIMLR